MFLLSSEGKLYPNSHLPPEAFDERAIFVLNECVKRCPVTLFFFTTFVLSVNTDQGLSFLFLLDFLGTRKGQTQFV